MQNDIRSMPNEPQCEQVEQPQYSKLGTFLLIISATAFALMAIFAKYAYALQINTSTLLSLRFLIASVVMWLVVFFMKVSPRIEKKQLLALFGLGALGYGLMSTFFFSAVKLVPASIAAILLYMYPVIVTILSAWINREAVTKYKIISLLISTTGLVMVVGVVFEGINTRGVFYGIMAAVIYSFYIIISNKLVRKLDPVIAAAYVITSAAVAFNIIGWAMGTVNIAINLQGWLTIIGIAVVSTVIAILTFFQGLKLVGPSKASIISSMEPVVTAIVACLLFSEMLTLVQIIGGGLVIGAVILIQRDR